jgi:hypothetical protein
MPGACVRPVVLPVGSGAAGFVAVVVRRALTLAASVLVGMRAAYGLAGGGVRKRAEVVDKPF